MTRTFQFDPRRPQRSHFSHDDKNDCFSVMVQHIVGSTEDYRAMCDRMYNTFSGDNVVYYKKGKA